MTGRKIKPTITQLTPQEVGADLDLNCGSCHRPFVSHQHLVCGVPFGDHRCPHCGQPQDIWPEQYEAALHHFVPRTVALSMGFPKLQFASASPEKSSLRKTRSNAKKSTILFAPAHPSAGPELHSELSRRMIAIQRRILMLAQNVEALAEVRQRPDAEERIRRKNLVDEGKLRSSFCHWAENLGVPKPTFIDGSIEQALADTDLLITHTGAPWIEEALTAGIEVMVLPLLPEADEVQLAPGAMPIRDAELEDAVNNWLRGHVSGETTQTITIGETDDDSLKILCAYRADIDSGGGAGIVMNETRQALERRGHQVDVTYEVDPDVSGYDIVHCFNVWKPETATQQIRNIKRSGVPIVWSPIYLDLCELLWAGPFLTNMKDRPEKDWPLLWQQYESGIGSFGECTRYRPNEIEDGFFSDLTDMVNTVDHVCVTSISEVKSIFQHTKATSFPFSVVPHGVHADIFENATPELFVDTFGKKDFVLCVGSLERRKNQIMIMEALKNDDLEVVLIGATPEKDYLRACDRVGTEKVFAVGRQPMEMVASAYKAAAVHVLPSFAEGAALANLEAAVSECPMVVSNRSSEFEYFSDAPYYCDPGNRDSIRRAVLQAIEEKDERQVARRIVAQRVKSLCSWDIAGELSEGIYRSLLSQRVSVSL